MEIGPWDVGEAGNKAEKRIQSISFEHFSQQKSPKKAAFELPSRSSKTTTAM